MSPIGWEAADMVHRNRMLGLAREAAAASTVDVLAAEVRELHAQLAATQLDLHIARSAADAANAFYLCEFAGWVTSASPREIREMFANAIEDYRDATGLTGVGMNREATGADSG